MDHQNLFAVVVEDDPQARLLVARILASADFEVSAVSGRADAKRVIRGQKPDLVVLGVRLPDGSGLELGSWIRALSRGIGIIALGASPHPTQAKAQTAAQRAHIEALTVYADDYLVKPFDVEELRVRVRNLMHRLRATRGTDRTRGPILGFAGWTLNADNSALVSNGLEVGLTAMEFRLVNALVQRKGAIASRAWLLDQIGAEFDINERAVDYHVCKLRLKLRKAGLPQEPIRAVRGLGYTFAAPPGGAKSGQRKDFAA